MVHRESPSHSRDMPDASPSGSCRCKQFGKLGQRHGGWPLLPKQQPGTALDGSQFQIPRGRRRS